VTGDLGDRELLKREMDGYEWCFHVAASYQLWMRNYAPMYATNVEGTRNVIEAAGAAGCLRIVYTSTVGCIALPKTVDGRLVPGDEMEPVSEQQMGNHYKRSKWQAECLAIRLAREDGLPVIIVNPSAPVGPRDVKPTPTGRMILDFLNRKMPGYVDSGLNWVSVRDVAAGHILAAEDGAIGERYILANAQGNWTIKETFDTLAEISGVPAPTLKLPHWVALTAGHVSETIANLTGRPPRIPLGGVRMAKYKMWFNPAKAIRELGLPQTPVKQAMAEAVEWFRANGYVKR
jgi:dihydroflavonol-4-reductase